MTFVNMPITDTCVGSCCSCSVFCSRTLSRCSLPGMQIKQLCAQAYISVAGAKQGPSEWLHTNQAVWPLVLPVNAVKNVLDLPDEEPWSKVSADLNVILDSSLLGRRLFGFAAKEVAFQQAEGIVSQYVEKLLHSGSVDEAAVARIRQAAVDALSAMPNSGHLSQKREVKLKYRDWWIIGRVSCPAEHVDFGIQAGLRGYAAASGDLPALPAEEHLCKEPAGASKGRVAPCFLRDATAARKFALSMVNAEECGNGEAVKDMCYCP